jgi:hypothetical protein
MNTLVQQRNRSRQWAPGDKRGVAGLPHLPEAGLTRRSILTGIVGLLAAPAIVRISSLMPISVQPLYVMFSVGGVPSLFLTTLVNSPDSCQIGSKSSWIGADCHSTP